MSQFGMFSQDELISHLKHYLDEKIEIDKPKKDDTFIHGRFHKVWFCILYSPLNHLMFSTLSKNEEDLEKFKKVLTEFMQVGPICYYEMVYADKTEGIATLEWDVRFPKRRLDQLINRGNVAPGIEYSNIKILNGDKIEDYRGKSLFKDHYFKSKKRNIW